MALIDVGTVEAMTRKSHITTSHWGAFQVTTEDDRIVGVEPFAEDPDPSPISQLLPAAIHHRNRVTKPSFRRGWLEGNGAHRAQRNRGSDEFVELPWDEALDLVAEELDRVREEHGNGSIFGGSYGWASAGRFHHALSQVHRFLNSIGGYVPSVASYSTAAAQAIMPHVLGMHFLKLTRGYYSSWESIAKHTQTLVMFGGINPKNSQVSMGGMTRHETAAWCAEFVERGKQLVNIAPQRGDGPAGSEWLPIVPGSDTAMMLAIAHVLETENLADYAFLRRCCVGYDTFRDYLLGMSDGQPKTPEWASAICEIDATTIRELARKMVGSRTFITVAWSLQRAQNGEQPFWMATVLAAMLGQIGQPGGGIGYGYGALGSVGQPFKRMYGLALPQGENAVKDVIPVARVADMLLNPGAPYDFNGKRCNYPDVRLVYWCGGNPFHHHQDLHRLQKAWQQPETIIVHEPWWTATARRSDIVLPATTSYERVDIGRAPTDSYLFHMPQLIPPVGEARDDYDIFAALAARLGVGEHFTEGRDTEAWLRHLYAGFKADEHNADVSIPDYDELCARQWVELPIRGEEHAIVPFADFVADPQTAPLDTPSGRIEIFSETIAGFAYEEEPGHPVWRAPDEWLGNAQRKYPLHLVSPQPGDKLHSQMECAIQDVAGERPERIQISCDDAAARGISNGDIVEVFNDRGACYARASISDSIRHGVVALPTGAWFAPGDDDIDRYGNPNVLTRDLGTSRIGQGCSAHTALVEIKCAKEQTMQ